MDTSVWSIKADSRLTGGSPGGRGQSNAARLTCVFRDTTAKGSKYSGEFFSPREALEAGNVGRFLERCARGRGLTEIDGPVQLTSRSAEKSKAPSAAKGSGEGTYGNSKAEQRRRQPSPTNAMDAYTKRLREAASGMPNGDDGFKLGSRGAGGRQAKGPTTPKRNYQGYRDGVSRKDQSRRDEVGSRNSLQDDEPLFSAVDAGSEEAEADGLSSEDDLDADEVEL